MILQEVPGECLVACGNEYSWRHNRPTHRM